MNSEVSLASVVDLDPETFLGIPKPPLLIDVRSGLEYASGHAPTAINLSLQKLLLGRIPFFSRWILPQWFRQLPKDQPVAVICLSAHRSPIAAQLLVQMGFKQVFNLIGGMFYWQHQKLPIQRGWKPT